MTLIIVAIAVPANTIFGVLCALAIVRRGSGRGNWLLNSVIGLPLALSPVVVGLALILVYGKNGWVGGWFLDHGVRVIFSLPGMVLATIFVSLPFVVREVVPVLREVGTDQEEAAWTLGASRTATFWRITLPAIRWGVAYGIVLTTARALGEYGAVAVVSGRIAGSTETLTLHIDERFLAFDQTGRLHDRGRARRPRRRHSHRDEPARKKGAAAWRSRSSRRRSASVASSRSTTSRSRSRAGR